MTTFNTEFDITDLDEDEIKQHYDERMKDLIDVVFEKRHKLGISQEAVADMVGVDRSVITKRENHKFLNMRVLNILKLCDALDLELIIKDKE